MFYILVFTWFANIWCTTNQVPDDHLGSRPDGKVEGGELWGILDTGVDIDMDTDQEQHTLNVTLLDGEVQEVTTFVVKLKCTS